MTEAEWLACENPALMLEFLPKTGIRRKLCLLAIACCRRSLSVMEDERSARVVEWAQSVADGVAGVDGPAIDDAYLCAATNWCVGVITAGDDETAAWAVEGGMDAIARIREFEGTGEEERRGQSAVVREIFGPLPFLAINVAPISITATAIQIADGIYTDRAFDRLPILADALEDAGCTNADILDHCRAGGEHVRGCWVVDLVLGKE